MRKDENPSARFKRVGRYTRKQVDQLIQASHTHVQRHMHVHEYPMCHLHERPASRMRYADWMQVISWPAKRA